MCGVFVHILCVRVEWEECGRVCVQRCGSSPSLHHVGVSDIQFVHQV